ncbi:MAG: amidohydrolase [Methanosarcinales archaeon]|nr:amidohydrolase [Methanosarcinales archaeon]
MNNTDKQFRNWIIARRREFHRIPEVSFAEFRTQEKVIGILKELGLKGRPIANTGVIATIRGNGPGSTIALRADMDGLEVTEELTSINREYISQHPGFMHACGHDAHMSIILGAARLLIHERDTFKGAVRLIFQPGEEQPPGGAIEVIRNGGLEGVDAIVGLHVFSNIDSGDIKFRAGPFMATSNIMTIRLTGKGGHHLSPHLCIDPISMASRFIGRIKGDIELRVPKERFTLGFGKVAGGSQFNRTPDEAEILGSFRTFDSKDSTIIEDTIRHTLDGIMDEYDNELFQGLPVYGLKVMHGYPVLVNDPVFSRQALATLKAHFPVVSEDIEPFFGAEDFAHYLDEIPGVYMGLGTRNVGKGIIEGNHSSRFDIDEDILVRGAEMLTTIVLDYLQQPGNYLP